MKNKTTFFRVEKNRNYSVISNEFLRRKDLSAKAKGILAYILHLPDDWNINLNEVMTHFTDGETSFRSGWKELAEKGYVERRPVREGQRIVRWETIVRESVDISTSSLHCDFQDVENLDVENLDVQNQELLNTNNTKYLNELNTNNNTLSSKHDDTPYQEIVEYLNEKTGSQYKHTTQATRNGIKARYNEGFKLDDFKRVIDIKTRQWLYDTKMKQYLRPQTLFGTKFEAYLNEQPNIYQFEDSMKRDEKEPTLEEIAEFEKAREQFDKYKRTYAQNQS